MKTKLCIVESEAATLAFVSALFGGYDNVDVTGGYLGGQQALERIPFDYPDVIMTELDLCDMTGEAFITEAKGARPGVRILVHSERDSRKQVHLALKAGACGYIVKGASSLEIITSVKTAAAGGVPLSPSVARHLFARFHDDSSTSRAASLTKREKEVVRGIARGLSEFRMAEEMSLSCHTVHTHLKKIYRKFDVRNRAEAVLKAHNLGLL